MKATYRLPTGETVSYERIATYQTKMARETASQELDRRTRKLMGETKGTYSDSMKKILFCDADLTRRFAGLGGDGGDTESASSGIVIRQTESPGAEVHRKTQELRRNLPNLTYAVAMERVLEADPKLKARFAAAINANDAGAEY